MISYYKTVNGRISKIDNYEEGCWINCVSPEENEVDYLISEFDVEPDFLRAALDKEELSHIDHEDGTTLIIIDSPVVEKSGKNFTYYTVPISIMITKKNVITISLRENAVIDEFAEGLMKNVRTDFKTHFVLHIILRMASKYLQYLNQINRISDIVETELKKSMKNQELIQLLEIEKSLVYFSSSLKAINATLEKIMRGRYIKLYEDDQDLLDDVMIEIKQAMEMSEICLNILTSTMDASASIISNNLNIVMKILASITLIMSIPTIISGFYGMNVDLPFSEYPWWPWLASALSMAVAWYILRRKDMI